MSNNVLNRLPFKIVADDKDQSLESVMKRMRQLKAIVADKRKRNVLDKDKQYTYHVYKWIFSGKMRFSYCDDHDWSRQKNVNGIKLHETIVI